MTDIRVKFFVDDDQLETLRKSAESTFQEFVDGFELVDRTAESTFFRFNRVAETNLKQTKTLVDRLFGGNDPQTQFLRGLSGIPPFTIIRPTIDLFEGTFRGGGQLGDFLFNKSAVKDSTLEPTPKPNINSFINPPPTEPINFPELLKEQEKKRIQEEIERLEREGKTIEELAIAVRDSLQKDLDNFGKFKNIAVPELEVNIPDLKFSSEQRGEIIEQIDPSLFNLDPTTFAESIENATNAQLQAFLTLQTTLRDLNNQYEIARKSLDSQSIATKDSTGRQIELNESLEELIENASDQAVIFGVTKAELTKMNEATDAATEAKKKLGDEGIEVVSEKVSNYDNNLQNLTSTNSEVVKSEDQVMKAVDDTKASMEGAQGATKEFAEETQQASAVLDGLTVFAADIAANINDSFADLIFNGLKGNFDSLGDLWKNTLDSMLETLSQFLATVISNPIRLSLEAFLGGGSGGGGGNIFSNLGGLGGSFKSLGSLFGIGDKIGGFKTSDTIGGLIAGDLNEILGFSGQGFFSTLGSAIPAIGAIASVVATAIPIIGSLFKKKPRLDLDFDTIRDDFGRTTGEAAKVLDFLNEDVFNNQIFSRSVSRKAGLGLGNELPNVIREAIEGQINAIQDIINQLPSELAIQLNDALLNTSVDIESEVKGDRLLEFDEKGKNIKKKFEEFINGDLQARFIFSIREFFVGAFESLGVLGDSAQGFIDQQFEEFQNLSGREARAEFGQEFIGNFQTLVDAFNVLNDNGVDSIGATVNQVKNLSNTLGFDAVPSIDELDRGLEELINAAELDPELIQDFLDLRAALLQVQSAILSSISSIIGNISSLNSTIVSLGGSAVDLTGFINQGLDASLGILGQEGLSLDDQEAILDQALGFANQLLAEEQAIFQQQQERAQRAAEARAESQRRAVQAQIDGLQREKELINENFDRRLEGLQKELEIAQEFERLTESIRNTLESIIFSSESVLTPVEQVGLVQSDITRLQGELASTGDPERRAEIAGQLEEAFERLFGLSGDAFGVNSPEFVAIFEQVTGGLESLAELTENSSRSVEEINAEIESLNIQRNQILETMDQRIDAAQERLASIQTQNVEATFQASNRVREVFELIRDEYIRIFEERMAQLEEVSELGFETEISALNALVGVEEDSLIVLRNIEAILSGAASFRRGSGGVVDFGNRTLAFLHGREAVVPESQITPFSELGGFGEMNVNLNVNVNGGSNAAVQTVSTEIENMLVRSIRQGGKLRSAIQEAGARRIN